MAYRTPDVIYGLVVIIGVDVSLTLEVKEPETMFATVAEAVQKVVIELAKDSVNAIADAVRKAVGDAAKVQLPPDSNTPS
jgi:hypothetical protein